MNVKKKSHTQVNVITNYFDYEHQQHTAAAVQQSSLNIHTHEEETNESESLTAINDFIQALRVFVAKLKKQIESEGDATLDRARELLEYEEKLYKAIIQKISIEKGATVTTTNAIDATRVRKPSPVRRGM